MIEISIHYPTSRRIDEPSSDRVRFEFVLPKHPFLIWADHLIGAQISYPRGYGIAYYYADTAKFLFAPIPFNILVGVSIWVWNWVRWGNAKLLHRLSPK